MLPNSAQPTRVRDLCGSKFLFCLVSAVVPETFAFGAPTDSARLLQDLFDPQTGVPVVPFADGVGAFGTKSHEASPVLCRKSIAIISTAVYFAL
jgi:hypothetical protein